MPHRFDATLKSIVADHPGDFIEVFGLPRDVPAVALNVDLSTISAATDVALGFGEPVHTVVDVNFQTGSDPRLAARLLFYNALLFAREFVPVTSIVVLLRPKADSKELTGKLAYNDGDCRVEFGYRIIRLWEQSADMYLNAGLAALPLALLCKMPTDQPLAVSLRQVVEQISRRLIAEADHPEAVRLMTAAYILTGLRVAKNDLASIYRGVGLMQESTAFDEAIEEGFARGLLEGETRGEARGRIQILLRLGRKRFGEPDSRTEEILSKIDDLDRLERMGEAILTAPTWADVLATR